MLEKLFRWLRSGERFSDNSRIRQVHRDFFVYIDADGRSVEVEAYLAGVGDRQERVLFGEKPAALGSRRGGNWQRQAKGNS